MQPYSSTNVGEPKVRHQKPIRELYRQHRGELDKIADKRERWDRMVEINVKQQIRNLAGTDIILKAWAAERRPEIHGWVYDLRTGYLKEIETLQPA